MPRVTPSDYAKCLVRSMCTAWNPAGTWDQRKGADPCHVSIDSHRGTKRSDKGKVALV